MADSRNKRIFMFFGTGGIDKTTVSNIISDISSSTVVNLDSRNRNLKIFQLLLTFKLFIKINNQDSKDCEDYAQVCYRINLFM